MRLIKIQSMTMATMKEMGVQNNDEGPCAYLLLLLLQQLWDQNQ